MLPVDHRAPSVASFVPGPGFGLLDVRFDIGLLRSALAELLARTDYEGDGFDAIAVTRRPGADRATANELSGRYWIRPDSTYQEVPREDSVDEASFSELVPEMENTYFATVHRTLGTRFTVGRMRILSKPPLTSNSFHRDPEPRVHIPIHTNPGALFIINHHCTHLPADGSAYFTDTRAYHTALNGGEESRVHLVAAVVGQLPVISTAGAHQ